MNFYKFLSTFVVIFALLDPDPDPQPWSHIIRIKTWLQKFWGGLTKNILEKNRVFWKKGVEIWAFDGTDIKYVVKTRGHMYRDRGGTARRQTWPGAPPGPDPPPNQWKQTFRKKRVPGTGNTSYKKACKKIISSSSSSSSGSFLLTTNF